jgi:lambda repressor-like predicted transcriptional regulator
MQAVINSKLKEKLDAIDRTGAWLARQIDRSPQQVAEYVSGKKTPKYELQSQIAYVLGMEVSEIWPAEVTQ